MLNPVILLQTTEPLSDLTSGALVFAAVAWSWRAPGEADRLAVRHAFLAFLAAGCAVMIRPANASICPRPRRRLGHPGRQWRDVGLRQAAAAVAGLLPPFLPQVVLNHATFGTWNPLIQKNLYSLQAAWGMAALKYGTLVMDGRPPGLVYANPFFDGAPTPGAFLGRHPLGYAATLLAHGFGLLDRDLPFTFVTDLAPWYRWPVGIANFLLLYLAAAGAVAVLGRSLARRRLDPPAFVVLSTVVVSAAYLALYLPVEVESRFGVAIQALAAPLIVAGASALRGPDPIRRRARFVVAALAPVALAAAVCLSAWIASHRSNPAPESPVQPAALAP